MNHRVAIGLLSVVAGAAHVETALAHHTRPTARPTSSGGLLRLSTSDVQKPKLSVIVGTELAYFDRFRSTDEAHNDGGRLLITTLVPSVQVVLATGTDAQIRLPVGFVRAEPSVQNATTEFGLGDLDVGVRQDLSRLWSNAGDRLTIHLGARLVAPTGRYRSDAALSVVGLTTGDDRALRPTTYDTQASLGAGIWSAGLGVQLGWRPHPRWHLSSLAEWLEPLSNTSDGIRWGRDVDVQVALTAVVWAETLALMVGGDYRWHDQDRVPDPESGRRFDVGGRDELGVAVGLRAELTDSWSCSARGHIPVWQRVGGVQLVETVSAELQCGYLFRL